MGEPVDSPIHPDARCPRCGYDLRGVIASWREACPIEGRCAECGLAFEWGELLDPRRNVPKWCVEYARWRRLPSAALRTLLLTLLRPGKFWRELRMVHEPRWPRLVVLFIVAAAILYVAFAGSVGYGVYRHLDQVRARDKTFAVSPVRTGLLATLLPLSEDRFKYKHTRWGNTWESLTLSPRLFARRVRFERLWMDNKAAIRSGSFIWPWGWPRHSVSVGHAVLVIVLCPFAFVALPQSLRKARVRWSHIVRIALYSVLILVPALVVFVQYRITPLAWISGWHSESAQAIAVYALAYVTIFWSLACRHYLKLPHAWGVGVAMVALAYASGHFAIALVDYLLI